MIRIRYAGTRILYYWYNDIILFPYYGPSVVHWSHLWQFFSSPLCFQTSNSNFNFLLSPAFGPAMYLKALITFSICIKPPLEGVPMFKAHFFFGWFPWISHSRVLREHASTISANMMREQPKDPSWTISFRYYDISLIYYLVLDMILI